MKRILIRNYFFSLFFVVINLWSDSAFSQSTNPKAETSFLSSDFGWISNSTLFSFTSRNLSFDTGLHFTPELFHFSKSPFFFEFKLTMLGIDEGMYGGGLGLTHSNNSGRSIISIGLIKFNPSGFFTPVLKEEGNGFYISGAAYYGPNIPLGFGITASIYVHPKQTLFSIGFSYIIDGAK